MINLKNITKILYMSLLEQHVTFYVMRGHMSHVITHVNLGTALAISTEQL